MERVPGDKEMMRKRKVEDYMKTIYFLQQKGIVRGAYIARELNVTKPTVSVSLKALAEEGYLEMLPDHSVVLTEKGLAIAQEVANRHNSIYDMLVNLGVDNRIAAADACSMEHAISRESLCALTELASKSSNWLVRQEKEPAGSVV